MNCLRPLFVFILSFVALGASAKSAPQLTRDQYRHWDIISTEDLLERACILRNNPEKQDSAMIWYSVAANRYFDERRPMEERRRSLNAMNSLGYMYFFHYGDYFKSYSYLTRALEIATANGWEEQYASLYLNLGNIYILNDDLSGNRTYTSKILSLYKKSFHWARKYKRYDIVCIAINNMLNTASVVGWLDSVKNEVKIFESLKIPATTPLYTYDLYISKAYKNLEANRLTAALAMADSAIVAVNTADTPERYQLAAISLKAHMLSLYGRDQEAIKLLDQMEQKAGQLNLKDFLMDIYREKAKYYKEVGDNTRSRFFHVRCLELQDSLLSESRMRNVSEMQFLDELNRFQEQTVKTVRQQQEQAREMMAAVIVSVVFALMLIWMVVAYRRQQKANRKLYERSLELMKATAAGRQLQRQIEEQEKEKVQQNKAEDRPTQELVRRIEQIFEDIPTICDPDFSLKILADKVEERYWTVSQTINQHFGKNFSTLLSEYRIAEACQRLNNVEAYGQFTIEGIGTSVGFRTRSNFFAVFKRIVGLTPSDYLKMARQQNNSQAS